MSCSILQASSAATFGSTPRSVKNDVRTVCRSYILSEISCPSFVSVINHLEKIREINCNETRFYLVIVVKNISLNMLKKKQRHHEVDIDEVFDAQSSEKTEDEIISKISSDEIKNALRDLSDKDYEVMFLYLVKEHTPAEIAQLLGITGIQARQRIFRARHRLIRHLEKRGITNET